MSLCYTSFCDHMTKVQLFGIYPLQFIYSPRTWLGEYGWKLLEIWWETLWLHNCGLFKYWKKAKRGQIVQFFFLVSYKWISQRHEYIQISVSHEHFEWSWIKAVTAFWESFKWWNFFNLPYIFPPNQSRRVKLCLWDYFDTKILNLCIQVKMDNGYKMADPQNLKKAQESSND